MVAAAPQSPPSKAGLLDRLLSFFILLFAWIALDRIFEHFNFLATGESFWHALWFGTLWAALLVIFAPMFSQPGMMLRRFLRLR
jgi:hypothetical protein